MILPGKEIVGKRFLKKKESYKTEAKIQKKACEALLHALEPHITMYTNFYEVGCGVGFLTEKLFSKEHIKFVCVNDLVGGIINEIDTHAVKHNFTNYDYLIGDAETLDMPQNIDAVISSSTIQWFHDLPSFIVKAYNTLPKNGLLAFTTYGPQNFIEIRKSAGQGLRYLTLSQLEYLLKPYFNITYSHEWVEKMHFSDALKVLRHIQATGVNGLGGTYFGKERMQQFIQDYSRNHTENNKVHLTYHPIVIVAQRKA